MSHDQIVQPNHKRVLILGAGVAGISAMNQIPRITGWRYQHISIVEDRTFHYNPLGRELLSYGMVDQDDIEMPLEDSLHDLSGLSIDTVMDLFP
jgi:NADH dehydrogenase FAD-containing subunit